MTNLRDSLILLSLWSYVKCIVFILRYINEKLVILPLNLVRRFSFTTLTRIVDNTEATDPYKLVSRTWNNSNDITQEHWEVFKEYGFSMFHNGCYRVVIFTATPSSSLILATDCVFFLKRRSAHY